MKFLSIIFFLLFIISCGDSSSSSKDKVCDPNPCDENNKTVCTDNNGTAVCSCDSGYVENENGECIEDINDPCDPNPCDENNKTICTDNDGTAVCSCDSGYVENENGECIEDINDPCDPNPCDENNKTICTDNNGTAVCSCDSGYVENENGECIINLCVDPNPCTETNRTVCTTDGSTIICLCNEGYHLIGNECISDSEDPCYPNPCTDSEGHKTRCLWDGEGGYECHCDYDYHDDNGLCCPAFTNNINGVCECIDGYHLTDEGCIIECTEDSVQGWNGWCPDGEICVQGICTDNGCVDFECPENSSCVTRDGEPFCECDSSLHMSDGICCIDNSSNVDGSCVCDDGYAMENDECIPVVTNPCEPNPCEDGDLHKNQCVIDDSVDGYHCECNSGYIMDEGQCVLDNWTECPTDLQCLHGYCVQEDRSDEQCLTDDDCHEYNPEAPTFCNPSAAGGICMGCIDHSDCPGNTQCNNYGTCSLICDDDNDCPSGRCYTSVGYCGQATCYSDQDCFNGTVCIDEDGDGSGMCLRIPCVETECSESNHNGTCPNMGESCVYGVCVTDCDPNPCNNEPNRTVCNDSGETIICECDNGYVEDENGDCKPESVTTCPDGFSCVEGYCSDSSENYFVCASDSDCGGGTCSPELPSGTCSGCDYDSDCPGEQTCLYGYCLSGCFSDYDCHSGMVCKTNGYCGYKSCTTSNDCPTNYICDGVANRCERIPCSE